MALLLPLTSNNPSTKSYKIPTIILISASAIAAAILVFSLKMFLSFLLCPQTPITQVNDLLVSNLKVSESYMAGIWLANLTIYNPSIALSISLNQIEASLLYNHDNALSFTSVDDFELDFLERKDVYVKFATTGVENDQPIVEYPLLREIEKNWRQGKVSFRILISGMARYEIYLHEWRRTVLMNPFSIDLDVNVGDGKESISSSNIVMGHAS